MNGGGKEYAIAMFSLSLENNNLEEVYGDLKLIETVIKENPEYLEYLVNPAVSKAERVENIKKVFEENVCENVFSFMNVLCDHGDMYILTSAISEFDSMYEDYMKYSKAVITSAVELTDEEKAKLISKLMRVTGKRIEAEYVIDKSLIGGLTVMVDGKYFDGSVRKNFKNIKEEIS